MGHLAKPGNNVGYHSEGVEWYQHPGGGAWDANAHSLNSLRMSKQQSTLAKPDFIHHRHNLPTGHLLPDHCFLLGRAAKPGLGDERGSVPKWPSFQLSVKASLPDAIPSSSPLLNPYNSVKTEIKATLRFPA